MPRLNAPESGVTVRMYRVGLGDCLLLALRQDDGNAKYILIDCGIFYGTSGGSDHLKKIVEDIRTSTGGFIDILVITHEHFDHLGGFSYSKPRKILEDRTKIQFGEIWFAWTENEDDAEAQELGEERFDRLRALAAASDALGAAGLDAGAEISSVLGFSGVGAGLDDDGEPDRGAAEASLFGFRFSPKTEGAIKVARGVSETHHYFEPGDWLEIEDVPEVDIHVLGPPRGALLEKSAPSSGAHSEVYGHLAAYGARQRRDSNRGFVAAALSARLDDLDGEDRELEKEQRPFAGVHGVPLEQAKTNPFFRTHYGDDADESWRRIDYDWLDRAADLALQLDDDTNNTSLVLAFELRRSGKVLLFPGDAQVGNWLSWHQLEFGGLDSNGDYLPRTAEDLLRRVVFYKVGHHGSHNATLRDLGLEMMTDPDLVAMIPTDEKWSWEKKGWTMPFHPLYVRLLERTRGRVIQGGSGFADAKPDMTTVEHSTKTWTSYTEAEFQELRDRIRDDFQATIDEFKQSVTEHALYFELTILDE